MRGLFHSLLCDSDEITLHQFAYGEKYVQSFHVSVFVLCRKPHGIECCYLLDSLIRPLDKILLFSGKKFLGQGSR